jgi:hypothetical protein
MWSISFCKRIYICKLVFKVRSLENNELDIFQRTQRNQRKISATAIVQCFKLIYSLFVQKRPPSCTNSSFSGYMAALYSQY